MPEQHIETTVSIPKYDEEGNYEEDTGALKLESVALGPDFVKIGWGAIVRVDDLNHALALLTTSQQKADKLYRDTGITFTESIGGEVARP